MLIFQFWGVYYETNNEENVFEEFPREGKLLLPFLTVFNNTE